MTRPRTVVFVAGTDTDVGKTWCTARLAEQLRANGLTVAARKPVQSGDGEGPWDSEVLATATGEDATAVCLPRRTLRVPWAPPMAADYLGETPATVADLVGELVWPAGIDVGLVEGVGGPRSPIAEDGDTAALARDLAPDLTVLVADAGLGVLNAVRLSVAALAPLPLVVLLNRFDPDDELHRRNLEWLARRDGLTTLPRVDALVALVARRG